MSLGKLDACEAHLVRCLREGAAEEDADVFLVGGCVRDKLLGKNTRDFDVSCPSHSLRSVMGAVQRALFRTRGDGPLEFLQELQPLFISEAPSSGVQVLSFKLRDRDTLESFKLDFRPLAEDAVAADALTRDFRINAIYYSVRDDRLVDPFGVT